MSEDVYRKLAQRLDTIPNGFSPTESGVELRLLAKIFSPAEAALACVLRLTLEPAADIAARTGEDPAQTYQTLKKMSRQGQIRANRQAGQLVFGLMPFAVGIYEEQLSRLDAELAALFEQYYQETQGGSLTHDLPAIHRVIPVEESIPVDIEIFPYERASELLAGAKSWAVRDCICRVQQQLVGKGCDRPVENCLIFAPVENAFASSGVNRAITKEEAFRILREAEAAGLVHSAGNYRHEHFYICNCCPCCCGIMRGVAEFGLATAVAHSDFLAVVEPEICAGCGDCLERCHFGALAIPAEVCLVDPTRCVGCGLCATVCSTGALHLERRTEGDVPPPPADLTAWMVQRAEERHISMADI
ncbi:MAG: 4Fe-4S binding protein [Anaerolineae bacterium]|nr:4Fe-4S binding protein [Anaerolineae bacterium]